MKPKLDTSRLQQQTALAEPQSESDKPRATSQPTRSVAPHKRGLNKTIHGDKTSLRPSRVGADATLAGSRFPRESGGHVKPPAQAEYPAQVVAFGKDMYRLCDLAHHRGPGDHGTLSRLDAKAEQQLTERHRELTSIDEALGHRELMQLPSLDELLSEPSGWQQEAEPLVALQAYFLERHLQLAMAYFSTREEAARTGALGLVTCPEKHVATIHYQQPASRKTTTHVLKSVRLSCCDEQQELPESLRRVLDVVRQYKWLSPYFKLLVPPAPERPELVFATQSEQGELVPVWALNPKDSRQANPPTPVRSPAAKPRQKKADRQLRTQDREEQTLAVPASGAMLVASVLFLAATMATVAAAYFHDHLWSETTSVLFLTNSYGCWSRRRARKVDLTLIVEVSLLASVFGLCSLLAEIHHALARPLALIGPLLGNLSAMLLTWQSLNSNRLELR